MTRRFRRALALMRKHDPGLNEEGFHMLLPHAGEHLDELIDAFAHEPDHGLRCWLLELIGDARSAKALAFLTAQLDNPDERLRYWAVVGLTQLDTREARKILWAARSNGLIE
jgi:hypothetical protein